MRLDKSKCITSYKLRNLSGINTIIVISGLDPNITVQ